MWIVMRDGVRTKFPSKGDALAYLRTVAESPRIRGLVTVWEEGRRLIACALPGPNRSEWTDSDGILRIEGFMSRSAAYRSAAKHNGRVVASYLSSDAIEDAEEEAEP